MKFWTVPAAFETVWPETETIGLAANIMGWDTVARGIMPCGVIRAPCWYLGMSARLSSCRDGKADLRK